MTRLIPPKDSCSSHIYYHEISPRPKLHTHVVTINSPCNLSTLIVLVLLQTFGSTVVVERIGRQRHSRVCLPIELGMHFVLSLISCLICLAHPPANGWVTLTSTFHAPRSHILGKLVFARIIQESFGPML